MLLSTLRLVYRPVWSSRFSSFAQPTGFSDVGKLRNVGIVAHVDAGKTTTTERMLYYAGLTPSVGEVDEGSTVTDFLPAERERGITISAAAITFPWTVNSRNAVVNLVDTPGHVDFTVEVERTLRVLDGGVVVLDASAGVQAQTVTVWRQAGGRGGEDGLSRIVFINKMDKGNADLTECLESIRKRLGCEPILIQIPVGNGKSFRGLVDLVREEVLEWNEKDASWGKTFQRTRLKDADDSLQLAASKARTKMIDIVCDHDQQLADEVISSYDDYSQIPVVVLDNALRRIAVSGRCRPNPEVVVTLLGSAYGNLGIQPLMDAVVKYLPHPLESSQKRAFLKEFDLERTFCGVAFKVVHSWRHQKVKLKTGAFTFIRVYSGVLKEGDTVCNGRTGRTEKVAKMYVAFAEDFRPISRLSCGQIGVVVGLEATATGDLICSKSGLELVKKATNNFGMELPDPVIYASIEPGSLSEQKRLFHALANLSREDPSLRVRFGDDNEEESGICEESGQTVISGMGELHLEIILDRIKREYKVDADLGPLMVSYRETVSECCREIITFERTFFNKKMRVQLDMSVEPSETLYHSHLKIARDAAHTTQMEEFTNLKPWHVKALQEGFRNAITSGPIVGSPIIHVDCTLHAALLGGQGFSGAVDTVISAAISNAFQKICLQAKPRLMEPLMKLEITSDKEVMQQILQDLMINRRALVQAVDNNVTQVVAHATVLAPLSELKGYSTFLRSTTSGRAFFGMEFSHFATMDVGSEEKAVKEVKG